MRLRHLLPFLTLAVGAYALPSPVSKVIVARDDVSARLDTAAVVDARAFDATSEYLAKRSVGVLGAGAFAGSGADSARITALQQLLGAKGHPVGVDGVWGPETSGAVASFQSGAGLAADGIPGPATLGALVDQVQQGDKGGVVDAAQSALNGHGAGITVDGDFGPATHTAAVNFQSGTGLGADGIIGVNTWTALFNGGGGGGAGGGGDPPGGGGGGGNEPPAPPPPPGPETPPPNCPAPVSVPISPGSGTTELFSSQKQKLVTMARYASTAYCGPSAAWTCKHCKNSPITKFLGGGGNTDKQIPLWYVAETTCGNIVVGIAGSAAGDENKIGTWQNIGGFLQTDPRPGHFPGGSGLRLFTGFYDAFAKMIDPITTTVKSGLGPGKTVTVVGHSQGGAIGMMVAASLQANVAGVTVYGAFFGAPRAGNKAWSDYFGGLLAYRAPHVINGPDIVSGVPPREFFNIFEYTHPKNEVWINTDGKWLQCGGVENNRCATSGLQLSFPAHLGPYGGVDLGAC